MTPESPPGFIVRTEAQKVTYERGFRLERGVEGPWLRYASTTAPGEVWLAGVAPSGPWFLAINHPGVATELAATDTTAALSGPGVARFEYARLRALYDALDRVYRLARSLPTVPLAHFQQAAAGLPRSTEAERMTIQRIGQNLFRTALMEYWDGRCPLTGITDPALLRASHIVPWASCDSDAQRLDVHNGLLLSALWDAAFDAGLVSFVDSGAMLIAATLSQAAQVALCRPTEPAALTLTPAHRVHLRHHRASHGF